MASSFIDFYIGYIGHPRFRDPELIEDDVIRVIVQKYEMILIRVRFLVNQILVLIYMNCYMRLGYQLNQYSLILFHK